MELKKIKFEKVIEVGGRGAHGYFNQFGILIEDHTFTERKTIAFLPVNGKGKGSDAARLMVPIDSLPEFIEALRAYLPVPEGGGIDPERKRAYLAGGAAVTCPFCGSYKTNYPNGPEIEGAGAWQNGECFACGRSWNDIYTLTDVESAEVGV